MRVQHGIRRAETNAPSLTDPLTGFGSRRTLLADLRLALEPESPASVLAIFDLAGSNLYRRVYGERASDELIARLAEAFALVVRPAGACYRPRQDEFCVLVDVPPDGDRMRTMLAAAASAVCNVGEAFLISSWYGGALLPDEASAPIEALLLADERLRTRDENRQPRERRQHTRPR